MTIDLVSVDATDIPEKMSHNEIAKAIDVRFFLVLISLSPSVSLE
jgi:hypothetical protein